MRFRNPSLILISALGVLVSSCVPETSSTSNSGTSGMRIGTTAPPKNMTVDELKLGFLTAYIMGDRREASNYASPAAMAKIPWKKASPEYIPYFDDKGRFWFDGGFAYIIFGTQDGRNQIVDLNVTFRR